MSDERFNANYSVTLIARPVVYRRESRESGERCALNQIERRVSSGLNGAAVRNNDRIDRANRGLSPVKIRLAGHPRSRPLYHYVDCRTADNRR